MPQLKRRMPLFDILAANGAAGIHASGAAGTERLLDWLAPTPMDTILDLGCGSGHSLALIRSRFGSSVVGVDANARMLEASRRRLRFCGISEGVTLVQADVADTLPFPDGHFDKIYCESVLGFQQAEKRSCALREIRRVLKAGGRFVANETLWLAETTDEEIARWNAKCLAYFGMIQADPDLKGPDRLKQHLVDAGFDKRSFRAERLSAEDRASEAQGRTIPESGEARFSGADEPSRMVATRRESEYAMRRSALFSRYQFVKSCLHPALLRERLILRRHEREMGHSPQIMQGWLIMVENG